MEIFAIFESVKRAVNEKRRAELEIRLDDVRLSDILVALSSLGDKPKNAKEINWLYSHIMEWWDCRQDNLNAQMDSTIYKLYKILT